LFASVSKSLNTAHAVLLTQALDAEERAAQTENGSVKASNCRVQARALEDAQANLEAQMSLAQVEMYIHNLEKEQPIAKDSPDESA
jgi:hypothetical protein